MAYAFDMGSPFFFDKSPSHRAVPVFGARNGSVTVVRYRLREMGSPGKTPLIAPTLSREEALRRLDAARAAYIASGDPLLSEEDISVLLDRNRADRLSDDE